MMEESEMEQNKEELTQWEQESAARMGMSLETYRNWKQRQLEYLKAQSKLRQQTHSQTPKSSVRTSHLGRLLQRTKVQPPALGFPLWYQPSKSEQGNTKNFDHYEDTPEIYQGLVSALVRNSEKLLSPSCHIICWLSLNFQEWTKPNLSPSVLNA